MTSVDNKAAANNNCFKISASQLPIESVTVYNDRAEVKRNLTSVAFPGLNHFEIWGLAPQTDSDSFRVEGQGKAIIHEVQFKEERISKNFVENAKVAALKAEIEALKDEKNVVEDLKATLDAQIMALDQHIQKSDASNTEDISMETIDKRLGYHIKKCTSLRSEVRSSQKTLKELSQKIEKMEKDLENMLRDLVVQKSVFITVECLADGGGGEQSISFQLSYQVLDASWTPSYDIRVSSEEKDAKLKLQYYGMVRQNTGEDWDDVQLVLSTGQPSAGGSLPQLGTLEARFKRAREMFKKWYDDVLLMDATPMPMMIQHSEAVSREGLLSTSFNIVKKASIPSGTEKEHKVTIIVAELDSIQRFECVPSKNTAVFMTSSAKNTTDCPFLAGYASIYVDKCFSTKVFIEEVSSGGLFRCSLGTFPSAKLNYLPVKKFHQNVGLISKTSKDSHEQVICVTNTSKNALLLTIYEPIPKTSDEKIQVKIIAPTVPHFIRPHSTEKDNNGSKSTTTSDDVSTTEQLELVKPPGEGVLLNERNNLEWTVLVGGGEKRSFTVKYEVMYPPVEKIEFIEVHE